MIIEEICKRAIEWGATDATLIEAKNIIVRDWVTLKCKYGCEGYGRCLTCPPNACSPRTTKKILSEYSLAILLKFVPSMPHADIGEYRKYKTRIRVTAVKVERELFLAAYYKTFALHSGPCSLCDGCVIVSPNTRYKIFKSLFKTAIKRPDLVKQALKKPVLISEFSDNRKGVKCRFPKIARPSMEAIGIDVFETAKKAGFELKPVQSREEIPTYFGLVLVE